MTTVQVPQAFEGLFRPARYKAYYGGRGAAKSHAFAQALVLEAAQAPLRVLCCREIQKSIRDSVKRLLWDKIVSSGLERLFDNTDTEIRGPNGSLFLFAGLWTHADSIKSLEGLDRAWVEEANTVSQRSLDLLIPTVRKPNSEIWCSWNPRFPTDPVDNMFRGGEPPPGAVVREVNFDENPWFPDVLRAEMEWDRRRDPDKYLHVWRGHYQRNSEARVFKNWRVEAFETDPNAIFDFGADWGFSVDPSTLIRQYMIGRTLYIDHEAWQVGCEIDHLPALFDTVPESRKWPIRADSARPETISYMQRNGFPKLVPATKGANSVEDGVSFLQSVDIVIHPRCRRTIDEFTMYSFMTDPQTGLVLPKLEDKNNHCIDASRYGLELRRIPGLPEPSIRAL